MKTIIAGSRCIEEAAAVNSAIRLSAFYITEVVSGGARGVDRFGEAWAGARGLPVRRFIPEWERLGRRAGFVRNADMADYADALVAIWDGKSKGTANMISDARRKGLQVYVYDMREHS